MTLRQRLRRVVLDADTRAGRLYNLIIFGTILISVAGLLVQPHPLRIASSSEVPPWVWKLEIGCLWVFIADFVLHLWVSPKPLRYLFSFYGLIDASAVLFFFIPQINSGLVLWIFKFGRVLRVFKLLRFLDEAQMLGKALRASARRIGVFLFFVVMAQVVLGYFMVLVESSHPETQFQTVGQGVYWAIVTMTTVGYGDIVPQTLLGRLLAAVVMLLGFGIIAIPTGIVTAETIQQARRDQRICAGCRQASHRPAARYCDSCGTPLPVFEESRLLG